MLWPVSCSVNDPSGFVWITNAAPFEEKETDFPFPENVNAEPVPPLIINPLEERRTALLPPVPETTKANEYACPAGKL